MKAGRELDALVAEKVMGQDTRWIEVLSAYHRLVFFKKDWGYGDDVPFYSTQIQDAWQVVEKMIAMHPQQDIHIEHLEGTGWQVGHCSDDEWFGYADTAPLAICLAALKAVGYEEE